MLDADHGIHKNACFQVELNGGLSSCHYQNNYNVMASCSPTVDSGIQSIADSPPADPFTPPTPYIPPPPVGFERHFCRGLGNFLNFQIDEQF